MAKIVSQLSPSSGQAPNSSIADSAPMLRSYFRCLSPQAAARLVERLELAHPKDPLAAGFLRLPKAKRVILLEDLGFAVGRQLSSLSAEVVDLRPSPLIQDVLEREVAARIAEALRLPENERLLLASDTLRDLNAVLSNPLFFYADPSSIRALESAIREMDKRLDIFVAGKIVQFSKFQMDAALSVPVAAGIALTGGAAIARPGASSFRGSSPFLAVLAAGAAFVALTEGLEPEDRASVNRRITRNERDLARQYTQLLESAAVALSAALAKQYPPISDLDAKSREPANTNKIWNPRNVPISPPIEEGEEYEGRRTRRRRKCEGAWVDRPGGGKYKNLHNEYCVAKIRSMKLQVPSPYLEWRVPRDARLYTQFDTFEDFANLGLRNRYYDFKTRYFYLDDDRKAKKWFAASELYETASRQKETLVSCDPWSTLVWVCMEKPMFEEVRMLLSGVVDEILFRPWQPPRK
ncbi:hypothetical protein HC749_14240 [Arthrobacter sp. S13_S34]|nr:hypothetical protein [Arthrobacter sp. S13_S34]